MKSQAQFFQEIAESSVLSVQEKRSLSLLVERMNGAKLPFVPESDEVWIDVSHTVDFPHTSGVQRVVRELAKGLISNPKVKLVRFIYHLETYRYLTASEIERTLEVGGTPVVDSRPPKMNFRRALHILKCKARHYLPEVLKDFVIIPIYSYFLRRIRQSDLADYTILVPAGNLIVIPEVFGVAGRVEPLRRYSNAKMLRCVPIFYDLIPLRRPDLAAFGDDFASYLGLFHFAERVSCISEAAKTDLVQYFQLIGLDRQIPKVSSHLLGCTPPREMKSNSAEFQIGSSVSSKKTFLAVGTIENRKNQISIVQSLEHLKDLADQIKFVFVGNQGPGFSFFLDEVERARRHNFEIEIILGANEVVLREAYCSAFVTMFCSLEEGFGLPILESRFFGKVSIVSDKGSMREVGMKLGTSIFVNPADPLAIAKGIRTVVTNGPQFQEAQAKLSAPLNWPTWRGYSQELLQFALGAERPVLKEVNA